MYLLDTSVCIAIINGTSSALVVRLRAEDPANIRLSSITRSELFFSARHSANVAANLHLLELFFAPFLSLPFDDRCAEHYGAIRAELAGTGRAIGPHDLLVAATARAHGLALVSQKTRKFSRVVGLTVEDWGDGT